MILANILLLLSSTSAFVFSHPVFKRDRELEEWMKIAGKPHSLQQITQFFQDLQEKLEGKEERRHGPRNRSLLGSQYLCGEGKHAGLDGKCRERVQPKKKKNFAFFGLKALVNRRKKQGNTIQSKKKSGSKPIHIFGTNNESSDSSDKKVQANQNNTKEVFDHIKHIKTKDNGSLVADDIIHPEEKYVTKSTRYPDIGEFTTIDNLSVDEDKITGKDIAKKEETDLEASTENSLEYLEESTATTHDYYHTSIGTERSSILETLIDILISSTELSTIHQTLTEDITEEPTSVKLVETNVVETTTDNDMFPSFDSALRTNIENEKDKKSVLSSTAALKPDSSADKTESTILYTDVTTETYGTKSPVLATVGTTEDYDAMSTILEPYITTENLETKSTFFETDTTTETHETESTSHETKITTEKVEINSTNFDKDIKYDFTTERKVIDSTTDITFEGSITSTLKEDMQTMLSDGSKETSDDNLIGKIGAAMLDVSLEDLTTSAAIRDFIQTDLKVKSRIVEKTKDDIESSESDDLEREVEIVKEVVEEISSNMTTDNIDNLDVVTESLLEIKSDNIYKAGKLIISNNEPEVKIFKDVSSKVEHNVDDPQSVADLSVFSGSTNREILEKQTNTVSEDDHDTLKPSNIEDSKKTGRIKYNIPNHRYVGNTEIVLLGDSFTLITDF